MTILFVFVVCLCASTVGGICGIGGGVVIKPLLDATGIMSVSTVSRSFIRPKKQTKSRSPHAWASFFTFPLISWKE